MTSNESIAVIIAAAGFGSRMSGNTPKQFITVGNKSILSHTVDQIQSWADVYDHTICIIVVLSDESLLPMDIEEVDTCLGGETRADSVANALAVLSEKGTYDWAMVHDAARPLIQIEDIETLYQAIKTDEVGGILAERVVSTVKLVQANNQVKTLPRDNLYLAQTPQIFRIKLLQKSLSGDRECLTDEASGIEAMGLQPKIIEGSRSNFKITTDDDLAWFRLIEGED